ncbi:MAG: hypothetical protein WBP13_10150 [Methylophilaceae bacterium]
MQKYSAASLPQGWFWSNDDDQMLLFAEYAAELPPIHPLVDIKIQVIAHREGTDDILVCYVEQPDHVAVVHLSWSGREEIANHPTVEYIGTYAGFITWEFESYGVGLSDSGKS